MDKTAQSLCARILAFIREAPAGVVADDQFTGLALEVFAFQFERNPVYRSYCEKQGLDPLTVTDWNQIPAVPTAVFKDLTVTCFPAEQAVAVFQTSGTTRRATGRHYFPTLALYEAALLRQFARHLLPDQARLPMYMLAPAPAAAPHSSLSYMLGVVGENFSTGHQFYVHDNRLVLDRLVGDLQAATEPVGLLGTAFAYVQLIDELDDRGQRLALPAGSRLMETGGFKGRSRALDKAELYHALSERLGIPPAALVNEYGMTELSSQFYDPSLVLGFRADRKPVAAWVRVMIIDPRSGDEAPPGEPGLIRILDLANLGSSICIQTEDLGVAQADGLEVLGRAAAAEPRGCSLPAETLWRVPA